MEDIEDMKAIWTELNNRVTLLEENNRRLARQICDSNRKTAKERLERKYLIFMSVEGAAMILMTFFIIFNPMLVEKYRIATAIYWGLFFLGEFSIDFYLYLRLREINIYEDSVSEISRQAARNWKIHKLAIIVGLPIAIGAIILFALAIDADKFAIYGMIVGGMIGLFIGITQLIRFMKYYRKLQN